MKKEYYQGFFITNFKKAIRVLATAALLLSAATAFSQDFVNFPGLWADPGPLVGSYTGGGTATISFTGGGGIPNPNINFYSPAPYISNFNAAAAGGAAGSQAFSVVNNSYFNGYKDITFTFSTPVFVDNLYIADIDRGSASSTNHDDRFSFTGITFSSVSSSYGGAILTGSGIPPLQLPGSGDPVTSGTTDNLEYASWQNSTTAVTSFTITFAPTAPAYRDLPNEVMNAIGYLQFALKVTPAITGPAAPIVKNISNVCPATTVNLVDGYDEPYPAGLVRHVFTTANRALGSQIDPQTAVNYPSSGTLYAFYEDPLTSTFSQPSPFVVTITNPCPPATINLNGAVHQDNNGNADMQMSGPKISTASGEQLYAVVYRVSDMQVLASQPITNGEFNFDLPINTVGGNYVVVLTTENLVAGSTAPSGYDNGELPSGWMYSSGQFNNSWAVTGGSPYFGFPGTVTEIYNFGIQQAPELDPITATISQPTGNAISMGQITMAVSGVDPDGNTGSTAQTLGNGLTYTILNPTNGTMYYDGVIVPAGGSIISNFDPAKISFMGLTLGSTSTSFSYSYTDAAEATATNTYTVNWTSPLPVKVANFKANITEGLVTLNWETTEETKFDGFEVEHSSNGKSWFVLGFVASKANSQHLLSTYSYNHQSPVNGENLYRLKMMDLDGSYAYSGIRSVVYQGDESLIAYPNPTRDVVSLKVAAYLIGSKARLLNIAGLVLQEIAINSSDIVLDFSKHGTGLYLLQTSDGRLKKIIKN